MCWIADLNDFLYYRFFMIVLTLWCYRGTASREGVQPESGGVTGQHCQTRLDWCYWGYTIPDHYPKHWRYIDWFYWYYFSFRFVCGQVWMKTCMWIQCHCMLHIIPAGTEQIQLIPGNQTTLDLRDLTVGVSYGVSVTALVGENQGEPVTVYIKPGELNRDIMGATVCFFSTWHWTIAFLVPVLSHLFTNYHPRWCSNLWLDHARDSSLKMYCNADNSVQILQDCTGHCPSFFNFPYSQELTYKFSTLWSSMIHGSLDKQSGNHFRIAGGINNVTIR